MSKSLAVLLAVALGAPTMAVAGPYIGAGMGGARTESTLTELGLFPALQIDGSPEYTGDDDFTSTDVSFDVTVGWMFGKHFGVEVGYTDFGSAEQRYTLPDACNTFGCQSREWTAQMEMTGIRAFVIGSVPVNDKLDAFLKLGAMSWKADYTGLERNQIFVPGPPVAPRNEPVSFDDDDVGLAAGMGLNLKTDSPFSVRVEFNYYDVDTTDLVWNATVMGFYTF
jgi:opacity protein-like surface antigen